MDFPFDSKSTKFNINLEGFYEEGSEKSLKKVKKLQKILERTGSFKSVSFIQGKGTEETRTHFSIKIVYQ